MKMFLIPEDLKNDLLAFLMEQPFRLVAQGVAKLQALKEVPGQDQQGVVGGNEALNKHGALKDVLGG